MATDKKLDYLHFCGGFGATAGLPLRHWELIAIRSAQALHPQATVLLHHAKGSWANAPAGAEHVMYSEDESSQWATWQAKHGAHQSDRVRLLALLKYGGLYQDTDSFTLRNCDHLAGLTGCAMPFNAPGRSVINGFIYAKLGSPWLTNAYEAVDSWGSKPVLWDATSCKLFSKLYRDKSLAGFQGLPSDLYTVLTWRARDKGLVFGELTDTAKQRIDKAYVAHIIDYGSAYGAKSEAMNNAPLGSVYEYILAKAEANATQNLFN